MGNVQVMVIGCPGSSCEEPVDRLELVVGCEYFFPIKIHRMQAPFRVNRTRFEFTMNFSPILDAKI